MFNHTNETSALFKACVNNNITEAAAAIKKGAEVNKGNSHGNLPLHGACMHEDNFLLVKLLFEKGADANFLSDNDESPLMNACRWDDCPVETVKYVFERTVPEVINHRDTSGDSALNDVVCFREDLELAKWMMVRGAELKSLTPQGIQKLGELLLQGNLDEVEMSLVMQILEHICCVEGNPHLLKKIILRVDFEFEKLTEEALSSIMGYLRQCRRYKTETDEKVMERFSNLQERLDVAVAKVRMKP